MKPRWLAFALVALISFTGCGRNNHQPKYQKELSSIEKLLNNRRYEDAIPKLEKLHQQYPQNHDISIKLLHALAGASSFEALKMVEIVKQMQKTIKEMNGSDDVDESMSRHILKVLAPIPVLNAKENQRLNQAIELYQRLDLKAETAGSYSNFKWGTLHLYRLVISVRAAAEVVKVATPAGKDAEMTLLEEKLIPQFEMFGIDIFMSYKLFEHSFDRVKEIPELLTKVIANFVDDQTFKLKIPSVIGRKVFYAQLFRDNRKIVSLLANKVLKTYAKDEKHPENEKDIVKLIYLTIENLDKSTEEMKVSLRAIYTPEFQHEVKQAFSQSLETSSSDPLKDLLGSRQQQIEILKFTYQLISKQITEADIPAEILDEVKVLMAEVKALNWKKAN